MNDEMPDKIIPESPNFQSELAEKLVEIAPEIMSDGKLDVARLRSLIGDDAETSPEKFGLFWPGKARAQAVAQLPTTATLKPAPEESVDWDTTKNLFIEGDNLEVLKALQDSYRRKIKMIYIDPPYNTGNEFIYPDNFQEGLKTYLEYTSQIDSAGNKIESKPELGGRRHSGWLNMMYPRLQLAKSLLSDDGVIFASIDDHEVNHLRKIFDEVFGEENFIAQITNIVKTEGRRYGSLAKTHDYMLVYAKNITLSVLNELEKEDGGFKYEDTLGGYNLTELRNQNAGAFNQSNRPNLRYPFYINENNKDQYGHYRLSLSPSDTSIEVYPIEVNSFLSVWRWGKEKAAQELDSNLVARKGTDGIFRIFQKYRSSTSMAKTVWFEKSIISNKGTKEVQALFNGKTYFDYPKPVALIEKCLKLGTNKQDIVLDFFSGSGTTAQAVMQLNYEDGGNRTHIQVQLPEKLDEKSEAFKAGFKTIADISKERIRRAGSKIKEDSTNKRSERKAILDTGFRVYKLASSNFAEWDEKVATENIEQAVLDFAENKKHTASPEDLLFEIMLRSRIMLDANIKKHSLSNGGWVYIVNDGQLIAYVDDAQLTVEQATEIADMAPGKFVALDSAFNGNDALKINIANICKDKFIREFKTI